MAEGVARIRERIHSRIRGLEKFTSRQTRLVSYSLGIAAAGVIGARYFGSSETFLHLGTFLFALAKTTLAGSALAWTARSGWLSLYYKMPFTQDLNHMTHALEEQRVDEEMPEGAFQRALVTDVFNPLTSITRLTEPSFTAAIQKNLGHGTKEILYRPRPAGASHITPTAVGADKKETPTYTGAEVLGDISDSGRARRLTGYLTIIRGRSVSDREIIELAIHNFRESLKASEARDEYVNPFEFESESVVVNIAARSLIDALSRTIEGIRKIFGPDSTAQANRRIQDLRIQYAIDLIRAIERGDETENIDRLTEILEMIKEHAKAGKSLDIQSGDLGNIKALLAAKAKGRDKAERDLAKEALAIIETAAKERMKGGGAVADTAGGATATPAAAPKKGGGKGG